MRSIIFVKELSGNISGAIFSKFFEDLEDLIRHG